MRLICISDTHTKHREVFKDLKKYVNQNDFNLLIHAGDISFRGSQNEVTQFMYDLMDIDYMDMKIFIAGNHDLCFEDINKPHHRGDFDWFHHLMNEENLMQSNCEYLEDKHIIIKQPNLSRPIKIYGTPWQPEFHNWAFNLPRNGWELEVKWNEIPEDTDVLITHSPPYGYGDYVLTNERVGCELLRNRVEQIKPLVHVFGHIHEGYGVNVKDKTIFANASVCNRYYMVTNQPHIIDINEVYGEIIATHIYAE
jgi:Icc-related predicted phosphoesterase